MASVRKLKKDDPNSPWIVEYTDAEGKRRRETPKSGLKKDAEAIRRRIERELTDGTQLAKSQTVTVARLCDLYAEHVESKVADGRVGRARAVQIQIHSKSIRARLGSHNLTELTRHHVEAFYNHLIANDKLAPITAKNRISTLRLMQDFAVKRGLMAKAPVAEAMKELRGTKKPRIRTFTQEEVGRILLAAADTKPYRGRPYAKCLLECFVNLAAFCGLRFGEIVALKPEAIDLDNRRIHIQHSYCRHAGVKQPKTSAGVRDVPLAPHVVALLRKWSDEFARGNPEGLLFTTWGGTTSHSEISAVTTGCHCCNARACPVSTRRTSTLFGTSRQAG